MTNNRKATTTKKEKARALIKKNRKRKIVGKNKNCDGYLVTSLNAPTYKRPFDLAVTVMVIYVYVYIIIIILVEPQHKQHVSFSSR